MDEYDPLDDDMSDYVVGQDLGVEFIGPDHPDYEYIKALFAELHKD